MGIIEFGMAKSPKLIVLTGATRGLGRALLQGFIKSGAKVAGCGRDISQINELRETYGDRHHFSSVDVSDSSAVEVWAKEVLANFGTPDLLINNAGIIGKNAPLWEVPVEEFGRIMDINIKGVHSVLHHFLPAMVKRKKGVVINFSSGWGALFRASGCTVLCYEVRDRRSHAGLGPRTPRRNGSNPF